MAFGPGGRPDFHNAYVYVDANYVRAELRNFKLADSFNPQGLSSHLIIHTPLGFLRITRYFFYDAVDEKASAEEYQRQQDYFKQVESLPFTTVVTGFVRPGKGKAREQKGVDVRIAVDALEAAWAGLTSAIILIAGDADFCPLAEAVRRTGVSFITVGFKAMSVELQHSSDAFKILPPVSEGYLKPF